MSLKINNLSYSVGKKNILKGIEINFPLKGICSIIGPNGSGKSTLIRNITNYIKPHTGEAVYCDMRLNKMSASEISNYLSCVPQKMPADVFLTAEKVLTLGGIKVKKENQYIINELDIDLLLKQPFDTLSGGEKSRLMLCRALISGNKLVILDEPLAPVDLQFREKILSLLKKISKNKLILLIIHDLSSALRTSDFVVVLKKNGEIYKADIPKKVFNRQLLADVFDISGEFTSDGSMQIDGDDYIIADLSGKNIHVIAGGGTGKSIFPILCRTKAKFSAGVINLQDSDWNLLMETGGECIDELPFSPVSIESHKKNLLKIETSDIIILSEVAFGKGNLLNLEALKYGVKINKPVLIHLNESLDKKDFVDGFYIKTIEELLKKPNVKTFENEKELITLLGSCSHILS